MKKLFKGGLLTSLIVVGSLTSCGASCNHTGGEATCVSLAVCELCGEEYGELDLTNHNYVAGDVTTNPTCTTAGEQEYNCECGASKKEPVSATGHSHSNELSVGEDTHYYACACGDKKDEEAHEYTIAGDITTAPTCISGGTQEYSCECGKTIEQPLDSLGGHIDEDKDVYCDREGCEGKVVQKNNSEVSIAWAIAAVNAELNISSYRYYITGTVKEVNSELYGYITITDGTNDLFIETVTGTDGTPFNELEQKAVVGDVVKLYGEVAYDENRHIPSMKNVKMTIVEHEHKYSEATCKFPATCPCGKTTGDALGHSSADSDTLCDRCGYDTSLTVAYLRLATEEGMDTSMMNQSRWTDGNIYFSVTKASGMQLDQASNEYVRVYKKNTFTAFVDAKYSIYQVTYHLDEGTSASTVTLFSNIFKADGLTPIIDGTNVTINVAGVYNLPYSNTTNTTIYLTGVTIAYK